jgi:hypothetical protein
MSYNSPIASTTNFGVVEVGTNIDVVTGVIDIPQSVATTATVTFDVINGTTSINGGDVFDNTNRVITTLTAGTNITITGTAPSLTINASSTPLYATTLVDNAASPYTVLASDYYIGVSGVLAPILIGLPAGIDGDTYIVKSEAGSTSNVSITPNGVETIEGLASLTIVAGTNGSVTLVFRGTNWNTV